MTVLGRVRRMMSDLSTRSSQRAQGFILAQIEAAERGARLAHSMALGEISTADARTQMSDIEHEGDDQRAQLVRALSQSLTTMIDREDLYRLSRSIDDVLDNLRDFVRESDLYQPTSQSGDAPLLAAVAEGLNELGIAVSELTSTPASIDHHVLAARKHGNTVRNLYQLELVELFNGPLEMEIFKRRELLRRIDVVALRLAEAADVLSDALLKRNL